LEINLFLTMIKSLASILILSFSIYSEGRPLQEPNRSLQTDDAVVVVENIENEFKVKVKVRQTVVGSQASDLWYMLITLQTFVPVKFSKMQMLVLNRRLK